MICVGFFYERFTRLTSGGLFAIVKELFLSANSKNLDNIGKKKYVQ